MMKKKQMLIILILLLTLLSSCGGNDQTSISKDGGMLFLTLDDIKDKKMEGFYVKNSDDTYTPVMAVADGYAGETSSDENLSQRYLWFTNNTINKSDLIPTVTSSTPLVAIFAKDKDMPSLYTLEKYAYKGYTIGCHIYKDQDDTLIMDTSDTLDDSSAGQGMEDYDDQDYYIISKLNGSDDLPVKNIDNNMQILLGLEKDKYYEIEFYRGTYYETLTTVADTLILQSEDLIVLQNPYKRTTNGYFTMVLPDNLEAGYYYICGYGLFRYAP